MRASRKKWLFLGLGLYTLGYLLYRSRALVHHADFSGAKLLHAVLETNPYLLILSVATIYLCYAVRAMRWKVFQKNLGPSDFWNIYKLTLAGFAAIFVLGRAGEPVRPLLIARKEKLPVADVFGIYVLERLFDFASTAVIAAIGLIVYRAHGHPGGGGSTLETAARTTGSVLFAGVAGGIITLIYLRIHGTAMLERRLKGWGAAHGWRGSFARIVLGFARGVQTIHSWTDLFLAVFYSGAHWFLVVVIYFWVSRSFVGALSTISLSGAMLVLAFTLVGSAVQLPSVGGGSQVASFLAYTTIFGVETEPAAAAAIVLWLITFAACSLAGVPLLLHEGWSLRELRRIAAHEKEEVAKRVAAGAPAGAGRGESTE